MLNCFQKWENNVSRTNQNCLDIAVLPPSSGSDIQPPTKPPQDGCPCRDQDTKGGTMNCMHACADTRARKAEAQTACTQTRSARVHGPIKGLRAPCEALFSLFLLVLPCALLGSCSCGHRDWTDWTFDRRDNAGLGVVVASSPTWLSSHPPEHALCLFFSLSFFSTPVSLPGPHPFVCQNKVKRLYGI